MVSENRFIAAALLPTLKIIEPSENISKVFEKADLYKEIEAPSAHIKERAKMKERDADVRKKAIEYDNREHLESGKPTHEEKK